MTVKIFFLIVKNIFYFKIITVLLLSLVNWTDVVFSLWKWTLLALLEKFMSTMLFWNSCRMKKNNKTSYSCIFWNLFFLIIFCEEFMLINVLKFHTQLCQSLQRLSKWCKIFSFLLRMLALSLFSCESLILQYLAGFRRCIFCLLYSDVKILLIYICSFVERA